VAVKPHAAPESFMPWQYLVWVSQQLDKLQNFRGFRGAQSYPSRTKDIDDVDFSTGSVGLGVAQTLFFISGAGLSGGQRLAWRWILTTAPGKYGVPDRDAELDEGNIYEALVEGWKHGIRNVWWVIDYNRREPRRRGP